jgi:hypothetical protein
LVAAGRTGQALGFLNAGVLQSTNSTTFAAVRTRGAWGEVYYHLTPCLHTHWGAGIDNPIDRDLAPSQVARNQTAFANLIWDITRQLRVGFELTWRRTDYVALPGNQGEGFHTQVQWSPDPARGEGIRSPAPPKREACGRTSCHGRETVTNRLADRNVCPTPSSTLLPEDGRYWLVSFAAGMSNACTFGYAAVV